MSYLHRVELLPIVTEIDYIMSNLRKWMKPTYTPVPIWMAPGIILASMGDEWVESVTVYLIHHRYQHL
jgi:hypothetical protein